MECDVETMKGQAVHTRAQRVRCVEELQGTDILRGSRGRSSEVTGLLEDLEDVLEIECPCDADLSLLTRSNILKKSNPRRWDSGHLAC